MGEPNPKRIKLEPEAAIKKEPEEEDDGSVVEVPPPPKPTPPLIEVEEESLIDQVRKRMAAAKKKRDDAAAEVHRIKTTLTADMKAMIDDCVGMLTSPKVVNRILANADREKQETIVNLPCGLYNIKTRLDPKFYSSNVEEAIRAKAQEVLGDQFSMHFNVYKSTSIVSIGWRRE